MRRIAALPATSFLFVVETFLRESSLFGGYIAISPSLWWDEGSLAASAAALLGADSFTGERRLFLSLANEGGLMEEKVDQLVEALESHGPPGLDWTYEKMPEESHGTIFHPAAWTAIRRFFATETKETTP